MTCEELFPFKDIDPKAPNVEPGKILPGVPPDDVSLIDALIECLKKNEGKPKEFAACMVDAGLVEVWENLLVGQLTGIAKYSCCRLREGSEIRDPCSCGRKLNGDAGPCLDPLENPEKFRSGCQDCCDFYNCMSSFSTLIEMISGAIDGDFKGIIWSEGTRRRDHAVCLAGCGSR